MKKSDRIWSWSGFVIGKLSGAGFALSLCALNILHSSSYDLYEFSEYLSYPLLWIIFYVYGVICSFVIDLLAFRFPRTIGRLKVVLYVLAGFSLFFIQGINVYTVIAGIVAALCALLFYGGTILSHQNRLFKYGFAFVIPLAIMIISTIDFTEKKGWQETRTDSTYEASFGYFNGKHEIPIEVERGETLTFSVSVLNKNGGGHGYHIRTDGHPRVAMREAGADQLSFRSEEGGTYRIVITGDHLKGSIRVNWEVSGGK